MDPKFCHLGVINDSLFDKSQAVALQESLFLLCKIITTVWVSSKHHSLSQLVKQLDDALHCIEVDGEMC